MSSYEITVPAPEPYKRRLRRSLRTPIIITTVFAAMFYGIRGIMHDHPVIVAMVPFLDAAFYVTAVVLQYRWAEKEELYFITYLKLGPDHVEVSRLLKDEAQTFSGPPEDFILEKKAVLSRTGSSYQSAYLEVYYQKILIARQYTEGDWTDLKFIEIVHAAKEENI